MMKSLRISKWLFTGAMFAALAGCGTADQDASFLGYVEAEYAYVAPPQNGWITSMAVREGDRVEVGDLLFELDKDRERAVLAEAEDRVTQASAQSADLRTGARPAEIAALEAQLENAQAQLELAQADHDRTIPLVEKGAVAAAVGDRAKSDLDRARAQVKAAEESIRVAKLGGREAARTAAEASAEAATAALEQAAWQLEQRSVAARRSGRIELVAGREGEFATVGQTVLAILPDDALKVRFFVPLDIVQRLENGDAVQLAADGVAEPVAAPISFIATEPEFTPPVIYSKDVRDKLLFAVEARLPPDAGLRPGLPVDVRLP